MITNNLTVYLGEDNNFYFVVTQQDGIEKSVVLKQFTLSFKEINGIELALELLQKSGAFKTDRIISNQSFLINLDKLGNIVQKVAKSVEQNAEQFLTKETEPYRGHML